MGCAAQKNRPKRDYQADFPIDIYITEKLVREQSPISTMQESYQVFDSFIDCYVKVPRLLSPIYNKIVQRRKMAKYTSLKEVRL